MEKPASGSDERPAGAPHLLEAGVDQAQVPGIYSRIAPVYDLWAAMTESRARRRALELSAIRDGESVLEVAVGTGLAFEEVMRKNPSGRNVGVDLTEAMLERARRRAAKVGGAFELRRGDAHRLEFPDATFDLVLNSYMFDLLPEADFLPVLREFRRVLRPGGRLVLVNMAVGERWHQRLYEALYRLRPSLMGGCRGVALEPCVREAGFTGVHRESVSQLGFPSEVLRAEAPGP
jgi:ubiquinone/menaquinone biosynthesis C-methylase UbiE